MVMRCRLPCVCRVRSPGSRPSSALPGPGRSRTLSAIVGGRRIHTSQVNWQAESDGGYQLPWTVSSKPFHPDDPYLHRLVGLFLLKRVANMHGHSFSSSDFLHGAKDAVCGLAEVVAVRDRHAQLDQFVDLRLCSSITQSLRSLPENAHVHLDIESIRNMHLSSINTTAGDAEPGDEHTISLLGQRIVTSQTRLQNLMDEDSKFTFSKARELGMDAPMSRLEFRLGVSFVTKEKFVVFDESGRLVAGSNQFRNCFHYWTFSSLVAWDTDVYPFQWSIVDINDFIRNIHNRFR